MRVSLTTDEKHKVPSLHLHNTAINLNRYIMENHRLLNKQERENKKLKEDKNNKLLEGLGIKTKIVKKVVEIKSRDHADTNILRSILKMIPIEPIHTKPFSKLIHTSKRVCDDGCNFLNENGLIHRSGQNRYKRNE